MGESAAGPTLPLSEAVGGVCCLAIAEDPNDAPRG